MMKPNVLTILFFPFRININILHSSFYLDPSKSPIFNIYQIRNELSFRSRESTSPFHFPIFIKRHTHNQSDAEGCLLLPLHDWTSEHISSYHVYESISFGDDDDSSRKEAPQNIQIIPDSPFTIFFSILIFYFLLFY